MFAEIFHESRERGVSDSVLYRDAFLVWAIDTGALDEKILRPTAMSERPPSERLGDIPFDRKLRISGRGEREVGLKERARAACHLFGNGG